MCAGSPIIIGYRAELLLGAQSYLNKVVCLDNALYKGYNLFGCYRVYNSFVLLVVVVAELNIVLQYTLPISVAYTALRNILLDVCHYHIELVGRDTLTNESIDTLYCKCRQFLGTLGVSLECNLNNSL